MVTQKSLKQKISFLWQVIAPFRRRALLMLVLMFIDSLSASMGIGMILPVFQVMLSPDSGQLWFIRMIPGLTALSSEGRILFVGGATLTIFTLKFIMGLLYAGFTRDFADRMRAYWSERIGRHHLYGPYANIVNQKQGVLLNNWLNEPLAASKFLVTYMQYLSSSILTFALFVLGLMVNWRAMVAFVVLVGFILLLLRQRSFSVAAAHSRFKLGLNQQLTASLTSSLNHLKEIKILAAESDRLTQIGNILHRIRFLFVRMAVLGELPRLLGEFLAVTAIVGVLVATTFVEGFAITNILPMLAFFFVASYRLITSSTLAMTARVKALQEIHSVQLVHGLSQLADEEKRQGMPIGSLSTDICFENVTFSYEPDRPLFTNLNLVLPCGQLIFIVGKSGTGKSTLLDLMLRLYNPQAGRILANHRDINDFELSNWRRLFGYVNQEATLFHGSIGMNVHLGHPGATDKQVEEVCRLAGCHDFIIGLPEGYNTLVGERGLALSGGQRKRIVIARALVGNPSVLILDEATSSFEADIEHTIIYTLRQMRPELTIIQVTHRLPAVAKVNLVLHLENGLLQQVVTETDLPQSISLANT